MPHLRRLIIVLILLAPILSIAQIHWQHSGGPIGATGGELYSDGHTAYYNGQYFLYRTTDGENWQPIYDRYLSFFSFYGDTLVGLLNNYVSTNAPSDSIAISLDGGHTWNELPLPGENLSINDFVATKLGVFLHLGDLEWPSYRYFIWKLANDGLNWEKFYTQQAAAQLFSAEGELYLIMYESFPDDIKYLIHYRDLENYDSLGLSFDSYDAPRFLNFYAHGDFMSIEKDALYPDEGQFYWSMDKGITWTLMDIMQFGNNVQFTTMDDKIYMLRSGPGLLVSSDDAQSWNPVTPATPITGFAGIAAAGGKLLTNQNRAVILSIDPVSGIVMQANKHMPESYTADTDYRHGLMWAAGADGLHTYNLADQSWHQLTTHYTLGGNNSFEYVDANETGAVMAARSYLSKSFDISLDNGLTWTTHAFPWNDSTSYWHLEKMNFIGDIIYVATNHKRTFRSADFGVTWTEITAAGERINSAVISWQGFQMIHTDNKIFVSADAGNTWQHLSDFTLGTLDRLVTTDNILLGVVTTSKSDPYQRIFISTDGINWRWAHDGLYPWTSGYVNPDGADNLLLNDCDFYNYHGDYYLHLGQSGLFGTSDTFKVWFPLHSSFDNNYELADSIMFYGYYGGLRYSKLPKMYGQLISGVVYFDKNDNGTRDANEIVIEDVHVSLTDPTGINPYYGSVTDQEGIYKLGKYEGVEDTLRCNLKSRYLRHINPPQYLVTDAGTDKHFGVVMEPDKTDLSIRSNSGFYRPGFDTNIYLPYRNEGTTEPEAYIVMVMDPDLEYISATPAPNYIQGDSLTWLLNQLPLLHKGSIRVVVHVPSDVLPGTNIQSVATIFPPGLDETPWDNTTIISNHANGSFDPNDKLISPENGLSIQNIKDGYEIFYTIRFQNTGNYPAENVRIIDPIDTSLVLNSVRIVSSSHPISSTRILPSYERMMEIRFDHIILPDSASDYAGSQGYVTFAAQRRKGLKNTVPTKNQARIYFDNNDPVYTNNKSWYPQADIISGTEDINDSKNELMISPNPAHRAITISSLEKLQGPGNIVMFSNDGRKVLEQFVARLEETNAIDISKLGPGVYMVQLISGQLRLKGRVVIQ